MSVLDAEALAVIEKVRKLLALANNNDNEHQAAAAANKAMELLEAYNLQMSDVERTKTGAKRTDNKRGGGLYKWQREVWKQVAALHFCLYEEIKGLRAGSKYEHRLVGSQANVTGAELMADYLVRTVERLAQAKAKEDGYNVFCREMIAYREGMADRLVERLRTMRRDRERAEEQAKRERAATARHPGAAPTGNALVLADVANTEYDLNMDHFYGYPPGTFAERRANAAARQAAAQAAADEELRLRDAAELADPALKAARLAKEAKAQADSDAYWKKVFAKQAKRKPRYRNATPEEERRMLHTFEQGRQKGDTIGLDQQIDKQARRAVK